MLFYDRQEAGRLLAKELHKEPHLYTDKDALVLGLARGGIIVANEVAKALSLPLNVIVPRKIGAPRNPELALGSIMENGEGVFNQSIINMLGVSQNYIKQEIEKEKNKAAQRLALYRQYSPLPEIKNKHIILVDDGIATGSTLLTAIRAMRQFEPLSITVAAPVSSTEAFALLANEADKVICPNVRDDFLGVGMFYGHFPQTEDQEVVDLLKQGGNR